MKVCGLDLSLTGTGVAWPDGSLSTVKPGKQRGVECLAFIVAEVSRAIDGADLAVIEGYAFGARGRAVFQIGELGGVVRLACHQAGVPFQEVAPASLKLFAAGRGNASKDEMVAAARTRGGDPKDDNQADALWLREFGIANVRDT